MNLFKHKKPKVITVEAVEVKEKPKRNTFFATDNTFATGQTNLEIAENAFKTTFQKRIQDYKQIDAAGNVMTGDSLQEVKMAFTGYQGGISDASLNYYGNQGFIGYQACAMLMQNWLIDKACSVPARDAVRKWFEVTVNDGTKLDPKVLNAVVKAAKTYKLKRNCKEFIRFGRGFGIRIAMFVINSPDEDYYLKPYNPDGITPGCFLGINQIDPYWITPELDAQAAANPASMNFYEPTWWRINGKRIHRSHLIIFRTGEVSDLLKPSYIYGGVSIPQKIYERVYAAERSANEVPQLLLTKRATVLKTNTDEALTDQVAFENKMNIWAWFRDNFGIKVIGQDEEVEQFETSLSNVDETVFGQYALAAAGADMPVTKFLGVQPTGLGATGEYDEASYHEELESTQENDLTPLVDRFHEIVIRSDIAPKFDISPFEVEVNWASLDALTAKEQAEINKFKSDTDKTNVEIGALDGDDVHNRLINDPDSGYNGLGTDTDDSESDDDVDSTTQLEGGKTLQQLSLGGPQLVSIIEVVTGVGTGDIPPETAKAILTAAFPLTPEQIDAIIDPVAAKAITDPIKAAPEKPMIAQNLKPQPEKQDIAPAGKTDAPPTNQQ